MTRKDGRALVHGNVCVQTIADVTMSDNDYFIEQKQHNMCVMVLVSVRTCFRLARDRRRLRTAAEARPILPEVALKRAVLTSRRWASRVVQVEDDDVEIDAKLQDQVLRHRTPRQRYAHLQNCNTADHGKAVLTGCFILKIVIFSHDFQTYKLFY